MYMRHYESFKYSGFLLGAGNQSFLLSFPVNVTGYCEKMFPKLLKVERVVLVFGISIP